jgi:hypothetical protein
MAVNRWLDDYDRYVARELFQGGRATYDEIVRGIIERKIELGCLPRRRVVTNGCVAVETEASRL